MTLKQRGLRTVTAIGLGCAAAIAFATTPASAITSVPAVYDSGNAGIVHEIGEKRQGYRGRGGYGDRHHHHITTMDMGLTGPTTATTMVVTVMPIPTGAVPASVSGSASRTSVAECNSVAWEGGDLRVAPTF